MSLQTGGNGPSLSHAIGNHCSEGMRNRQNKGATDLVNNFLFDITWNDNKEANAANEQRHGHYSCRRRRTEGRFSFNTIECNCGMTSKAPRWCTNVEENIPAASTHLVRALSASSKVAGLRSIRPH